MKRLVAVVSVALTLLLPIALAPAANAEVRAELGCDGCGIRYGTHDTWYTGCWSGPSTPPRLEAKVDGRWVVYDSKAKPIRGRKEFGVDGDWASKQLVCADPDYPYIMAYTFTVKDEGTLVNAGDQAGRGLLPMREVWTSNGKTKYEYLAVYVVF